MPEVIEKAPAQHQNQMPGIELDMSPRPVLEDERYRGSGKLENKKTLITGGDSGIGAAAAIAFAKEGADVAIVYQAYTEDADAQHVADRIKELGRDVVLIRGDLKDRMFCQEAIDKTVDAFGRIDVLVNHAGEDFIQPGIEQIPDDQMVELFENNFFSMFYLTKRALPHMPEGSSIINTTSVVAYKGKPDEIDYSATKGAVLVFTRSLAQSLGERKIRVNGVAPGPIYTAMAEASRPAEKVATMGEGTVIGRPGQPWEMAPSYVFLASEIDSSYMTGQVLHPDGGDATFS